MIHFSNVSKVFGTGTAGLSDVTLTIEKGEFVFLVGQTGSGKTTLLKLLIRDILPSKGKIFVNELDIVALPMGKIPHLRKKIGVIFQDLKLLMDRTILENVSLPLEITGVNSADAKKRVEELLAQVGVLEHKDKFPVQLSGGELQRVAIARALTLTPDILLADEPTGNLDSKTAFEIVELLAKINSNGTTIIMATHNTDVLHKYPKNRVIELHKGQVEKDKKATQTVSHSASSPLHSSSSEGQAEQTNVEKPKEELDSFSAIFSGKIVDKIKEQKIKEKPHAPNDQHSSSKHTKTIEHKKEKGESHGVTA